MPEMIGLIQKQPPGGRRMPLLVTPAHGQHDLARLAHDNRSEIETALLNSGAILFRGFPVNSAGGFAAVVDALGWRRLDYRYRSTPRESVGERVYTASAYPADRKIPMHNENAYQPDWPMHIAFFCAIAATQGGETPISDMVAVTQRIGQRVVDQFEGRQVKYVRHYWNSVDLPWQTVFQTEDRAEVARYCAAQGLEHRWLEDDLLQTMQVCQGAAIHPRTGDRFFFNQAHLFHVSSQNHAVREAMIKVFGELRLPRNAFYGDGGEIDATDLAAIRDAFDAEAVRVSWRTGDILLLDNMQVAHGRNSFAGKREVLTALADPYSCCLSRRDDVNAVTQVCRESAVPN